MSWLYFMTKLQKWFYFFLNRFLRSATQGTIHRYLIKNKKKYNPDLNSDYPWLILTRTPIEGTVFKFWYWLLSRFPNCLDKWLKMRKQLGLLMLFAASIHVSITNDLKNTFFYLLYITSMWQICAVRYHLMVYPEKI